MPDRGRTPAFRAQASAYSRTRRTAGARPHASRFVAHARVESVRQSDVLVVADVVPRALVDERRVLEVVALAASIPVVAVELVAFGRRVVEHLTEAERAFCHRELAARSELVADALLAVDID